MKILVLPAMLTQNTTNLTKMEYFANTIITKTTGKHLEYYHLITHSKLDEKKHGSNYVQTNSPDYSKAANQRVTSNKWKAPIHFSGSSKTKSQLAKK